MGVLTLAVAAGAAVLASAAAPTTGRVEQSGNTRHVAVCPPAKKPLQARCHAHVVTDAAGNPIVGARNPTPSGAPGGAGTGAKRSPPERRARPVSGQ